MKLIIQNNRAVAAAADFYVANGTEQDIVSVPDTFDVSTLDEYVYMGNSLASAQASMTASLETYRLIAQNAGLPYTFPDGTGTIQTRDQTQYPDISNINGRVSEALILSLQNDTTTTINFRDEQNITHAMTAPQIIAMGTAVSQFVTNTYTTKWAKEVEISQLTEENYQSYDITEGW